ncbi:conserved hypothetical protein [uncultured Desulfatiglans sp.]|uniref:PD(D/E)XK endonuclease domain-containing protein n=1 Tax=Uncultured Desulfatiglans sp. TaxID=1748965 RepID=A0A653AAF3_UNCDX|nr:conserved hypothetical protein [uncultured Desulfatiglans sp.]
MKPKRTRRDTKLESEGAEFLVLGRLLLEKITAFKTYTNFPGYDLIATSADNNTSARIQVKSRYQTNWDGFIINNFECEFVVFVALNRGYSKPRKSGDTGISDPEFYVLPISYVMKVRDPNNEWGKIVKNRLVELDKYRDQWGLIQDFLMGNK